MTLNNITLTVMILFSLFSCRHADKKAIQLDANLTNKIDSIANDTLNEAEPSEAELFQKTYNDLIQSYHKKEVIDSVFNVGLNHFHIKMEYSCLINANFKVPKQYLAPFTNKDFSTHDFMIKLSILKNDKLYLERKYEKQYFFKQLQNEDLKKYGVLFCPYLERKVNNIILGVSLTIPLTDVGEGVQDTIKL